MSYALINKLTAKPGKRAEVIAILLESGKLNEPDPACKLYLVSEDAADPNVIWVQDLWDSKAEHEAAMQNPALRPYIAKALPLLEGMPQQTEVKPVGGIGL